MRLRLTRLEDRIVFDGAGVVVDLQPGAERAVPAELTPLNQAVYFSATGVDSSGQYVGRELYQLNANVGRELSVLHQDPSSIRIIGDRLVFADENGDRDNRIVVASDGLRLMIRDENGHSIGLVSPIVGATGAGTSEVFIPFTSISHIDTLELDSRGGDDSVTFQLVAHADTILDQFSRSIVDGGTDSVGSVGDQLRFIGDGTTKSRYTPDGGLTGKGVVVVSSSAHQTEFGFVHVEPIEFTGMAEATLIAPVTPSGRDLFQLSEGLSLLDGSIAALVVSGNVGGTPIESIHFHANETVILDAGGGAGDEISVAGAANAHQNTNLILKIGPSGQNPVVVLGAVGLAGNFSVFAGLIDVRSAIEVGGSATLSSRDSIIFGSAGKLSVNGLSVALTADSDRVGGGGIFLLDGAVISAESGSISLLATGDITLGRLVSGNGTSVAVRVVSSASRVRDGGDRGGADITAVAPGAVVTIHAAAGVGTAGNALDLDVRHLIVTTTDSNQFLAEQDELESLRLRAGLGSVTLAAAGSILDGDTELDVQAQNLVLRALAVGSVSSPLQTEVATLTAQLSGGGLELEEHDGLTVLSATALASNGIIGLKSFSGDLQLVGMQANGLVSLQTPGGAVLRSGELPLTITAAQLEIAASGGVGTMLRPLRTTVAALEADGGTGGLFVENTGDIVIGGIASSRLGLSGLAANGADLVLSTQGSLTTTESIHTTQSGNVLLTASVDLLLGSTITTDLGDIGFAAARDLVATGAVDIVTSSGSVRFLPDNDNSSGGSMRFGGIIDAGIGTVIFRTTDGASLLTGSIRDAAAVIKLGPGTLTVDSASVSSYRGVTELREGTLRVDGVIGATNSAQPVFISGGAVLSGSGDVNAAIFSASTASLIRSSGSLKLGDGTAVGLRFAGQLLIGTGHQVVLRDADLAELGVVTVIASGARLVAANGFEVGAGEMLSGSGALAGNLIVLAGGQVTPGTSVGILATDSGNLALSASAQLLVDINGVLAGDQHDQIDVRGSVSVDGAILVVHGGQFRPVHGTVLSLIVNDGTDPVSGRFLDASGRVLNEGATVRFNGIDTIISYVGGPGANDITLTVSNFQLVRTSSTETSSARNQLTGIGIVPPPSEDRSIDRMAAASVVANDSTARSTINDSADLRAQSLEVRAVERLRVFFRVVNDGTDEEEQTEYDLAPDVLGDLLQIFKRYRFQDGHYRIYLREPGKPERLILDVNVAEGRVAPANLNDLQVPDSKSPQLPQGNSPQEQDADKTPDIDQPTNPAADAEKPDNQAVGNHRASDASQNSKRWIKPVLVVGTVSEFGGDRERRETIQTTTPDLGDADDGAAIAATTVGVAVGALTAIPEWRERLHGLLARGNFPGNNISRLVQRARREITNRRPR